MAEGEGPEDVAAESDHLAVAEREDGGGARHFRQEAQLPERAECAGFPNGDLDAVRTLHDGPETPGYDDVHRVTRLALAHEDLAGADAPPLDGFLELAERRGVGDTEELFPDPEKLRASQARADLRREAGGNLGVEAGELVEAGAEQADELAVRDGGEGCRPGLSGEDGHLAGPVPGTDLPERHLGSGRRRSRDAEEPAPDDEHCVAGIPATEDRLAGGNPDRRNEGVDGVAVPSRERIEFGVVEEESTVSGAGQSFVHLEDAPWTALDSIGTGADGSALRRTLRLTR